MLERLMASFGEFAAIFALSTKLRAAVSTLLVPFAVLLLPLVIPESRVFPPYDVLTDAVLESVGRLTPLLAVVCWIRLGCAVARVYRRERARLYRL